MKYVEYLTQEFDRWDLISQAHYGTPYEYERIIAANPTIPITPVLPPRRKLAIPVIASVKTVAGLPPWKRGEQ